MAIAKIVKIEGANISWNCKQIGKMVSQKTISFDNIIQRSYCWEVARRSEFIWSIIMGYPIPPVYAKRGKGEKKINTYDILDGQQRLTTVSKFMNDEFVLSNLKPIPYLDEEGNECEVDISGKSFSELDEELQDAITNRNITVHYYDTIEQAQEAEMFRRLNNGKPLSAKAKTLANCKDIQSIINIGEHHLFSNKDEGGMMSASALKNKNQVTIIMKIWAMLNKDIDDISFESKVFNPMIQNTVVSDEDKEVMADLFDYVEKVHKAMIERKKKPVSNKLYTETHFVSLVPFMKELMDKDFEAEITADWLIEFFFDMPQAYIDACNGSAKPVSIKARHNILNDSYENYFSQYNKENEGTDEVEDTDEVEETEDGYVVEDEEEEEGNVSSLIDELMDNESSDDDCSEVEE